MSAILQTTRRQEWLALSTLAREVIKTGRSRAVLTGSRHARGSPSKMRSSLLKEIRWRSGLGFICSGTIGFSYLTHHSYSTPVTWYPPSHLSHSRSKTTSLRHNAAPSYLLSLLPSESHCTSTCCNSSLQLRIFHCPLQSSWLLSSHHLGKGTQSSPFWFSIVCLLDGPFVNSAVHTPLWCQV